MASNRPSSQDEQAPENQLITAESASESDRTIHSHIREQNGSSECSSPGKGKGSIRTSLFSPGITPPSTFTSYTTDSCCRPDSQRFILTAHPPPHCSGEGNQHISYHTAPSSKQWVYVFLSLIQCTQMIFPLFCLCPSTPLFRLGSIFFFSIRGRNYIS